MATGHIFICGSATQCLTPQNLRDMRRTRNAVGSSVESNAHGVDENGRIEDLMPVYEIKCSASVTFERRNRISSTNLKEKNTLKCKCMLNQEK